jgi:uncharacterized membrane-anchored protein
MMEIVGWHEAPHYDHSTNYLTWSIIGASKQHRSINRIVKLLGRRGVMTATLVCGPDELGAATGKMDQLLQGYRFKAGSTYAEFLPGKDTVAKAGLTALIVGGAGAALVKSGLLGKLWKFIAIGVIAVGGGISRMIFGRKRSDEAPPA